METKQSKSSDSFAPIELEERTLDLDEETEALLGNRRHSLRLGLSVGAVAFVGVMVWMDSIDNASEHAAAAASLQQIQVEGIERFWNCAVPNTYPKVRDEAGLVGQIHAWSARNPNVYAQYVQSCMQHLTAAESELALLPLSDKVHHEGLEMRNAMTAARSAWAHYLKFLADPNQDYDADTSRGHAFTIAHAKTEGARALSALKEALQGD